MRILILLSAFLAGHFLGDFPFQNQWMIDNKGKSWEVNAYHALVYTAVIFSVTAIVGFIIPISSLGVLIISHFLIDPLKARWKIIKSIWIDQILHILILFLLAVYLIH
jgi:hypothetical protein